MNKAITIIVSVFLLIAAGYGVSAYLNTPKCPQEDSCTIDYRDHGWYVNDTRVSR